jgi:signal transduction histidine kinase
VVWADHDRMEQVFVNLLNNAFGHNSPGTRVRVTAGAGPAEVVISVQDDGQGMPPELAAAPFEPGRRTPDNSDRTSLASARPNAASRRNAGAGLGLSIAKGIMQAHGGRLELAARPKGTCFGVYLPVEAEVHPASARGYQPPDGSHRTGEAE